MTTLDLNGVGLALMLWGLASTAWYGGWIGWVVVFLGCALAAWPVKRT